MMWLSNGEVKSGIPEDSKDFTYMLTQNSSGPSGGIVYGNYIPLQFSSSVPAFAAAVPSTPGEICLGVIDDAGGSAGYADVFCGSTFGLAH